MIPYLHEKKQKIRWSRFLENWLTNYRISSIKRRGALKIFEVLGAALFRGWRSFQIYYFLPFKDSRNQETTDEIYNCHFDF